MINPTEMIIWKQKFAPRNGAKYYRAGFDLSAGYSNFSRRTFRTAAEALAYGARVPSRWCRLYNAAILAMVGAA